MRLLLSINELNPNAREHRVRWSIELPLFFIAADDDAMY